ncbi:MAG: hypothetical protein ACD_20C00358G0004 [uncultured bacterium]|nr:MAG: hypothetical protein ACD_20C00358G0004 [uncultured bacterium]HBH19300.1 hypothetical protein [Cyanobacteria bacterium UBA9579]
MNILNELEKISQWADIIKLPFKIEQVEDRVKILEEKHDPYKCPACHNGKLKLTHAYETIREWQCNTCNEEINQEYDYQAKEYLPRIQP